MRQEINSLLRKVTSYALQSDSRAFKRWVRKYPGYVGALLLLFGVVMVGFIFVIKPKMDQARDLRLRLGVQSGYFETKLEQKNQRLAAVLSHLEANPQVKAPGNHQSLIGPYAKMEWKYSTTENGQNHSSYKDSILEIQKANTIVDRGKDAVAAEVAIKWKDSTGGNGAGQYSPKHSIIEIINAADPLSRDKTIEARVAGEAAWYPIALSDKLGDGGTFLWRVIEGEKYSSGQLRAEGSWGPYSVFTIYPTVYQRIRATGKIRIGTYNVGQVKLEGKASEGKKSCVKPSDGLSENDSDILCRVLDSRSITEKFGKLEPAVTRYSDIDAKLLPALTAGELDIALGNISKADYRTKKGVRFLEYETPKPILLTSKNKKEAPDIGPDETIGIVQGTVYEHVLGAPRKILQRRYRFKVYQNTFDAIGGFLKNDVQWILMMGTQTWDVIQQSEDFKKSPYLHQNTTSNFLKIEPKHYGVGGDAFAITETDSDLHNVICLALREIDKNRDCKTLGSRNSQKEEVSFRVGSRVMHAPLTGTQASATKS